MEWVWELGGNVGKMGPDVIFMVCEFDDKLRIRLLSRYHISNQSLDLISCLKCVYYQSLYSTDICSSRVYYYGLLSDTSFLLDVKY